MLLCVRVCRTDSPDREPRGRHSNYLGTTHVQLSDRAPRNPERDSVSNLKTSSLAALDGDFADCSGRVAVRREVVSGGVPSSYSSLVDKERSLTSCASSSRAVLSHCYAASM